MCAEHKPQFHKPVQAYPIKATQLFERLNIDFKVPLESNNRNSYFFNVIDEYSSFPLVFPCMDVSTPTVIQCLSQIFAIFGKPDYVYSDRGSSFMCDELLRFFLNKGIATSRTTAYNATCNGQVEKYIGTIWKVVTVALKTCGLPMACWQDIPDSLHSLRSLLCTTTNCSPHERLLKYARRPSVGGSVSSWLITPGLGLL